jgi:hypothetical protein
LHEIVDGGGEGVVMRKVGSYYEYGRSPALLKLKKDSCADMEGIVVAVETSGVRLKLYAILLFFFLMSKIITSFLSSPTGTKIMVPQSNVVISTPSLGDIVTFSYTNRLQNEIIVGPTIIRVRTDLTWEDVVANAQRETRYTEGRGERREQLQREKRR